MREAYKEAMDHIAVTEEMQARILTTMQNTDLHTTRGRSHPFPVRYLAAAACFALLIAVTVALPNFQAPIQSESPSGVQNGILDKAEFPSLHALSQAVGFEVEALKNLPFDVIETQYTVYGQSLAEVKYIGQAQDLVFRKTVGNIDPSGDYTVYSDKLILEIDGISVVLKGASGVYSLAVWGNGAYSYSIKSAAAFSDSEWMNLLGAAGI